MNAKAIARVQPSGYVSWMPGNAPYIVEQRDAGRARHAGGGVMALEEAYERLRTRRRGLSPVEMRELDRHAAHLALLEAQTEAAKKLPKQLDRIERILLAIGDKLHDGTGWRP